MEQAPKNLQKDEQVSLALRGLFESYGYKKYKVSEFEDYALYLQHKNLFSDERIITFTDFDGRLMALRPDVTLSIVKNATATAARSEKLYYIENVYRARRGSREFAEINQMGLELLGRVDAYTTAEVVGLALHSLAAIDPHYTLDLSHMGFLGALLDAAGADAPARACMLEHIRAKNPHDLARAARQAGLSPRDIDRLAALCVLSGPLGRCLPEARALCDGNAEMLSAVEELRGLYAAFSDGGFADHLRFDSSIVSDLNYYNGVIFQGFVRPVPGAVLSGGRYDSLLARFGSSAGAIGFAIYLDSLPARYPGEPLPDADILLLYGEQDDPGALLSCVRALAAQGARVRAERTPPQGLRYGRLLRFDGKTAKEEPADA